ncbi:MAG TPA: restriction endonuclease subunit S [Rhodanobacteraceae bacterium]|nr:restriction endonuclease subunit S [Rhodanobacteraceae bacterium]
MNNLQDDEWDFADIKRVSLGLREARRYRLRRGDLLFNRTNSKELVGKCGVFNERGVWVFASYLIRVCTDAEKLLPQFAAFFINSPAGRIQIDRVSRQIIGMTNVNAEELRELAIPLPPMAKQRELVDVMETARSARRAKLAEADALLAGMDAYLLETLGLALPAADDRRSFALTLGTLREQSRLGPYYFHPERVLAIHAMEAVSSRMACAKLSDAVAFVRDQIKTPDENYIGLAGVQSQTGELSGADEEAEGACFTFQRGDVLFARLRPYLNKVWLADSSGCCSPEFHVLRVINEKALQPEYLAAVLRSSLVLSQTRHMMTGNTHPRLANEDVVNLVVPVPDAKIQQSIAAEIRRRRERARVLRAEAEAGWAEARLWFEEQLLGPTP